MKNSLSTSKLRSTTIHVSEVMSVDLVTVQENDPVSTAVTRLLKHGVGSVAVMNKQGNIVGIITKGDVLREVVMRHADPNLVKSNEIMSEPVIAIGLDSSLEDASKLMIQKKVSKLAVLENENLKGIITSTDIIRVQPLQVNYLEELVRARYVPRDLRQ